MLSVYDLECDGLRDPQGITGAPRLSWRLGSDRKGAWQASYRLVVVSLETGDVLWDSGEVAGGQSSCAYGGVLPEPGTLCSWFVVVTDSEGTQAQSLPAAFRMGRPGDAAFSDLGPRRMGFVWTSDPALNDRLDAAASDLDSMAWREILGVRCDDGACRLVVEPRLAGDLAFAQGSYLLPQGLLVVRWERAGRRVHLEVSLPPGVEAELGLCGVHKRVGSGRSSIEAREG